MLKAEIKLTKQQEKNRQELNKLSKLITEYFDKYQINDETPTPIRNIIILFKTLNAVKYIKDEFKLYIQFILADSLRNFVTRKIENLAREHNIESKKSNSSTNSNSSAKSLAASLKNKIQDPYLKQIVAMLSEIQKKISDIRAESYYEFLKDNNFYNFDNDLLQLIINQHLLPGFHYLLAQNEVGAPLIQNEIISLQHYMIAILTELKLEAVNWEDEHIIEIIKNSPKPLELKEQPRSFAARMLQACIYRARLAAEVKKTPCCEQVFLASARDALISHYLSIPGNIFLPEIFDHPMQFSVEGFRWYQIKFPGEGERILYVKAILTLVKDLIFDPISRRIEKESNHSWFFERYSWLIYEKLEELNQTINSTDIEQVSILARSVFEFNALVFNLQKENKCLTQPYIKDLYPASLDAQTVLQLSQILEIENLETFQKTVQTISSIKNKFITIQTYFERTCFFSGAYQKLNQCAYWLNTLEPENARNKIGDLIQFEISKDTHVILSTIEFLADQSIIRLPEDLKNQLRAFILDPKAAKQNLKNQINVLVEVIVLIINHKDLKHNFPIDYYIPTAAIDNKSYKDRINKFPSAISNISGPQSDSSVLINRTETGEFLAHKPRTPEELTQIFMTIYLTLVDSSDKNIIVLGLGIQNADIMLYPDHRLDFQYNDNKYRLTRFQNNGEWGYKLFKVNKFNNTELCSFIIYNLETLDNKPPIVDDKTEDKLIYIYHQPHKIIHCSSTVGRSLTHQLAITGIKLIDFLMNQNYFELEKFLNDLIDMNNSVYQDQFDDIRKLMAIFNFRFEDNNDSRLKVSEIVQDLQGFLPTLNTFFIRNHEINENDIQKIGSVFIDLLSGLRQMQYAIQESDQMLGAIAIVLKYYAKTVLRISNEELGLFRQAFNLSGRPSYFAPGFDVAEEQDIPQLTPPPTELPMRQSTRQQPAPFPADTAFRPMPISSGVAKTANPQNLTESEDEVVESFSVAPPEDEAPRPEDAAELSPEVIAKTHPHYIALPQFSTAAPQATLQNESPYVKFPDLKKTPTPLIPVAPRKIEVVDSPLDQPPVKLPPKLNAKLFNLPPNPVTPGNTAVIDIPPDNPQGKLPPKVPNLDAKLFKAPKKIPAPPPKITPEEPSSNPKGPIKK